MKKKRWSKTPLSQMSMHQLARHYEEAEYEAENDGTTPEEIREYREAILREVARRERTHTTRVDHDPRRAVRGRCTCRKPGGRHTASCAVHAYRYYPARKANKKTVKPERGVVALRRQIKKYSLARLKEVLKHVKGLPIATREVKAEIARRGRKGRR